MDAHSTDFGDPNQLLKDFLKHMDSLDFDGSITTWEDLTTRFLAQFFPPGRTVKLCNDILMFQQHHGESLLEAWTRFKERTVDQLTGGKLHDRNAKESWALLEDLAVYDNESWNDPRDFAKPVKAIALPQCPDGPHDTQYCMDDPEQVFVKYASLRTDETGEGLVSNFMASQNARLSKFKADFKQQKSEMANKINTILKAITDRIASTLPSNTTKNPKLSTSPVLSARSYPTIDPQCSSHPSTSINAIKVHSKEVNISQTSLLRPGMEIETQQPEEPEPTLEDEFQDLHLNLPVLEVLAHASIYNAILDKYVESLELGKNGSSFVQGEVPAKMEDPGLFTLPCRLGDSNPFDTLADLGSCVNIIPLYLFKKFNIGLLEETDHIFGLADGTKSYPVGIIKDVEVHIGKLKLLISFYVIDMKKDPETPLLVGRGFLATAIEVIDCRMAKIAVEEGIIRSVFEVKGVKLGEEEAPYWTTLGKRESYKTRPRSDGVGAQTLYYARKDFLDCHLPGE
ncbi:MAK10-like protein [Tanacetum coccineum]